VEGSGNRKRPQKPELETGTKLQQPKQKRELEKQHLESSSSSRDGWDQYLLQLTRFARNEGRKWNSFWDTRAGSAGKW
jgi:hypothetical protein